MVNQQESIPFGPFRLEMSTTRLLRNGAEVELRPRAFRLLQLLIQNPGRVVDYPRMIREAWEGIQVSHHTIAVTIGEIKSVLGEYGAWIHCRPKFGYSLEMPQTEDLLRRGWHFSNQYTRVGFENALRCFEEAAGLDGADFRAFEAISRSYLMLAGFLMRAPRDAHGPFLDAHHRAAALCGLTPELRLDRAFGRCVFERNLAQAERELLALRAERPNSTDLYIRLALVYLAGRRLQEASALLPQAEAGDALAPELAFLRIVLRLFAREFEAAVHWGKTAVDLHPSSHVGRAFYAEALDSAGFTEQALAQYRLAAALSPDTGWIRADQARCLAVHGQRAEALAILDGLLRGRETEYVDGYHLGLVLEALGRRGEALREMERAYDEMSYALMFSALDAKADRIRSDPRFANLCNRVFAAAS